MTCDATTLTLALPCLQSFFLSDASELRSSQPPACLRQAWPQPQSNSSAVLLHQDHPWPWDSIERDLSPGDFVLDIGVSNLSRQVASTTGADMVDTGISASFQLVAAMADSAISVIGFRMTW